LSSFLSANADAEMDWIKDCPIATPVLTEAYGPIREGIIKSVHLLMLPALFSSSRTEISTPTKKVYHYYFGTP
jgi:hypothetical protein